MTNEELERAVERVDRWANYEWTTADQIAVKSELSTFTAGDLRALLSERAELLAAVERMRVALQPFAEVAEEFSVCGDGQPISIKAASGKSDLNVGHLRRAAEAAK